MSMFHEMYERFNKIKAQGPMPETLELDHEDYWMLTKAIQELPVVGLPEGERPTFTEFLFCGVRIVNKG